MVNVKNLFGMAVMASALVACSSNDDVNPNPENPTQKGQAYAAFKINLPTTNGTRVDGDPTFDGGDASEYAVNNGTVLVFKKAGKSEGDYTFVTSAPLTDMNPWKGVGTDGVTTEATIVVDLGTDAKNTETDYYALVLLNNVDKDEYDEDVDKINLPTAEETFKKWSEEEGNATKAYASVSNGIVMANAPQYVSASAEPTTLVKISGIYPSKEQAAANTATNIYVERGLAKVTVNTARYAAAEEIDGGTYNKDKVQILDWGLDVINKKTYPVHVTTGLSTDFSNIWGTERFYDGSNTKFKRVYWAKDPNYSGYDPADVDRNFYVMKADGTISDSNYKIDNYTRSEDVGEKGGLVDVDKSYYCCENTFDINNMLQNQTTRVVFRAKYSPKDMTDGENAEYGGTFFMLGTRPETWTPTKFLAQIKTYVVEAYNEVNPTNKISVDKVTIEDSNLKAKLGSGAEVASEDVFDQYLRNNISVNGSALTDADGILTSVKAKLGKVYTYANGISYYVARIKHFNERTSWAAGDPTYDNKNDRWLGRYGVVRNNWYNLTVTKISNPGSPTVPTLTNDPDDENKSYISVSINILDWAKRSQSVEL